MGQTLTNGIYLPDEGEVRCYDGLAANWTTLDYVVGGYRAHVANENIHITSAERSKWNTGVTQAYVLRYASVSLTALGTVAFSSLDNTDNIKIGDKVLDSEGKLFALTAVDTANSTATLSALLIDLSKDSDLSNYYTKPETDTLLSNKANDSDVVHKSGNETISGNKTFSSTIRSTGYPNIRIYVSDDEWDVQPADAKQSEIRFTDKNSVIISYFAFQHRSSSTEPFRTCWRQLKMDGTNGYYSIDFNNLGDFYPENTNAINLGTSAYRWKGVYATNYYYGSNNVEFSTKFVTTDTNQTVSGSKTFSSNVNVYNSDNTATTPNLYFRSSKIEISSQGNTSGDQNLTYLDKNNTTYAYVKGAVQSNGSAVKIRATAKDSSDNSVINELQLLAYTNGNKAIFPTYSNEVDLGTSSYKWKSINGLTPSSLSMPDLSNGIDISSYITDLTGAPNINKYTPVVNGWISVGLSNAEFIELYIPSALMGGTFTKSSTNNYAQAFMPVIANKEVRITLKGASIGWAKFYPCQGNV